MEESGLFVPGIKSLKSNTDVILKMYDGTSFCVALQTYATFPRELSFMDAVLSASYRVSRPDLCNLLF